MYQQRSQGARHSTGRGYFGHRNKNGRAKPKSIGLHPSLFVKRAQTTVSIPAVAVKNQFSDFEIIDALKNNVTRHGYTTPTAIQDQVIPQILAGRDLIGLANTGTGKTAAYLIPIVNKLFSNRSSKALIVVPTRELALQIRDELKVLAQGMPIYSALIIGGASQWRQIQDLSRNPQVVIGTPGRLKDLIQRKILVLKTFSTFVLDEVDLMADIGFINDIKYFMTLLPKERQSLFFSATLNPKIQEVIRAFVVNPVTISVKQTDTLGNIDQDIVKVVNKEKKVDQLRDLLIKKEFEKVLIFGRTKHGVDRLSKQLVLRGFKADCLHGDKTQYNRQKTLESFRRSEINILLATDVAARGLDINNVTHVINFDLPENFETYTHRIGRTGRMGKPGTALTFVD